VPDSMLIIPPRRHGKFRPTLMKLVSSNDEKLVKSTAEEAVKILQSKKPDLAAALDTMTKLRGIGPATASLLLAVHNPENVIFFADEAFYWLCCGGEKGAIKYNAKEYKMLDEEAATLSKRLGVRAVDIEKVAFVLMREGGETPTATQEGQSKPKTKTKTKTEATKDAKQTAKRKNAPTTAESAPVAKRSTRSNRG
jgi:predicted flap endonuclease-1-like 5' DNA nuclease